MNLPWQPRNQNESGFITIPENPGACESSGLGPGRRGHCCSPPPTEPDVRALPHPVPHVPGSLEDVAAPAPQMPGTTAPRRLSPPRVPPAGPITRRPLPPDGSRWPRFPAFDGNMKARRLPTLHPSDLVFSPFSTMHACSVRAVARALPTPRRQGIIGPGSGFRAGCTPDRPSCTWTVPGLSGSLATHPVTLQRSPAPEGPAAPHPSRRLRCSPHDT